MRSLPCSHFWRPALVVLGFGCLFGASIAAAAPVEPVRALAAKEKAPLIDTLKGLVSIESGSGDREGLPDPADIYHMVDTPKRIGKMVQARFTGAGTSRIMLIAHMDTVYLRGMLAQQPFRIDGNRAYGLAVADDKQGIAVILHTLAILKAMRKPIIAIVPDVYAEK